VIDNDVQRKRNAVYLPNVWKLRTNNFNPVADKAVLCWWITPPSGSDIFGVRRRGSKFILENI
jgi:hypothetical protein